MADHSLIEWTDATWNPVLGCNVVSPGCAHCFAMKLAGTRLKHSPSRAGLTVEVKGKPVWNGQVRFMPAWLDQPLRWQASRRIFVVAHGDLFHGAVQTEWLDQIFAVMGLAQHHEFQVLTKRPEAMLEYLGDARTQGRVFREALRIGAPLDVSATARGWKWPLPNVHLGISAEDQLRFDVRIEPMTWLKLEGWRVWASLEPLLGPVRLDNGLTSLDWVVIGGESGKDARPMHPDWARGLRNQCAGAGILFHFKQWGEWAPVDWVSAHSTAAMVRPDGHVCRDRSELAPSHNFEMRRVGKKAAGASLDGREHRALPGGTSLLQSTGELCDADLG